MKRAFVMAVFLFYARCSEIFAELTGIMVPAYANPAYSPDGPAMWQALADTAADPNRRFAIRAVLNPDTGPGGNATIQEERFAQYFGTSGEGYASSFRNSGGVILGYVSTLRGQRALNDVKSDIDAYLAGVYAGKIDGIFLDDFFDAADDIEYYEQVFSYVTSNHPTAILVGNAGNVGDTYSGLNSLTSEQAQRLIGPLNSLVSHEMTASNYRDNYSPLVHAAAFGDGKFTHLVHDAGATWDESLLNLARSRRAGWFYATPDAGDNPWDNFNTNFWNGLTGSVNAIPEPAAALLFTAALTILVVRKRYRDACRRRGSEDC